VERFTHRHFATMKVNKKNLDNYFIHDFAIVGNSVGANTELLAQPTT
jgi:hypothetical protein